MTKFPDEKTLKEMRELLKDAPASKMLHPNASSIEKLKFSLCEKFVIFLLKKNITQKELAKRIGIDVSLMSKIVHYDFNDFTIDRLVKYLSILFPKSELKITIKNKTNKAA